MYEAFYGFREKPFSLLPDPDFLFPSAQHRMALTLLEYGLVNQAGFTVITGGIGTGKTTLIRHMLNNIEQGITVGLISNIHPGGEGLLPWILQAYELEYTNKNNVQLYDLFVKFLIREYAEQRRTVLIIDEAQNLPPDTLEQLRMLFNVNVEKYLVLQIILVGQVGLRKTLQQPQLQQFAQRIAVDYHLKPLAVEETYGYIRHRLQVAGGDPELFQAAACERVYEASGGVPRLINLLCDTALVYGYAEQLNSIGASLVEDVVRDKREGGLFQAGEWEQGGQEEKKKELLYERKMTYILGISAYYHDSAAALLADGEIVSAAQEERFSRKKHDARFPGNAITYCLSHAGIRLKDIDQIVFYDKPLVKFERLLETYLSYAPKGFRSFVAAMPVWLKEKLYLKNTLKKELASLTGCKVSKLPPLLFAEHHQSHAASAFFPSPFEKAAVMCLDGVGEWATTSVWLGEGSTLTPQWEIDFPHSLGMLYSAFTYYTGFKVNSGEYKLMGLAPYGVPKYVDQILDKLLDLKEDGTFRLNMDYFNYCTGLTMTNGKFNKLFGGPPRKPESPFTQREMDIASSIQMVTEEVVLRLARTIHKELGADYLCMAGGVALNCVANGRILREGPFKDIWIQPAAGDAGGALGAALVAWHLYHRKTRTINGTDSMHGAYLGPAFSDDEIRRQLDALGAKYQRFEDKELMPMLAGILAQENVVGWFQGRMEFGPRALGARSIIGDPRSEKMQSVMNLKIKYRESFRPFAPSVLAEEVSNYFDLDRASPYMLIVAPVKEDLRIPMSEEQQKLFGIKKLHLKRSQIPAITHVDYSARVQTVHKDTNSRYHDLLSHFKEHTGCAVLVNTSFNVRGEPIVCTPEDAYRCFMRTEMDYLVVENYLLAKAEQSTWKKDESWKDEFELD